MSVEEKNQEKRDLKKAFVSAGLVAKDLGCLKSEHSRDAEHCHQLVQYEMQKIRNTDKFISLCRDINSMRVTKMKPIDKFKKRFSKDRSNDKKPEERLDLEHYLIEKGLKKKEDGDFEVSVEEEKETYGCYSNLKRFVEAKSLNEFTVLYNTVIETPNLILDYKYFSKGCIFDIIVKEEIIEIPVEPTKEIKGKKPPVKPKTETKITIEYEEMANVFYINEENKLAHTIEPKDYLYRNIVHITRDGIELYLNETLLLNKKEEKKYEGTIDFKEYLKSKKIGDVHSMTTRGMTSIKKILTKETDGREEKLIRLKEFQPIITKINRNAFSLLDRKPYLIQDVFIILREVILKKSSKPEEEEYFLECVFVTITDGQSKTETEREIESNRDYRYRAFFNYRDQLNNRTNIRSIITDRTTLYECLTGVKASKLEFADTIHMPESYPTMEMFGHDRRVAMKLNLDEKNDIIKMKEYQTRTQLRHRILTMQKIVQAETAGVRYNWSKSGVNEPEVIQPKASPKSKSKREIKSTGNKGSSGKKEVKSVDETEKNLDPNAIFAFKKKLEMEFKGGYCEKNIEYRMLGTNPEDVEETIYEPNLNHIVKFITEEAVDIKKEIPLLNHSNITSKNDIQYIIKRKVEKKDLNTTNLTSIDGTTITDVHEILVELRLKNDLPNVASIPIWKPNAEERKKLLEVKGLFALNKDNKKIEFYKLNAVDIWNEYYLFHKNSLEKTILQNVLYDCKSGPIYFSELKTNLGFETKSSILNTRLPMFVSMNWDQKPVDDIIADRNIFDYAFSTEETILYRKTEALLDFKGYKLRFVVMEPNLKTSFYYFCKKGNNKNDVISETFKFPHALNELITDIEGYQNRPILNQSLLARGKHVNCPLATNLAEFFIISKVQISLVRGLEPDQLLEEYCEPKLVRLMCLECIPQAVQLVDDCCNQVSLCLRNEMLGEYDVFLALENLENQCYTAANKNRRELAFQKYKDRIQRCMRPDENFDLTFKK